MIQVEKPLSLRIATKSDAERLALFGRRAFEIAFGPLNTPENMAAYLDKSFTTEIQAAELADPKSVFFIAERDGQMQGYARLLEGPADPNVAAERPVELVRIYARPGETGRGVGSALMKACLEEAAQRGCDVIWLGVWQENPRAVAFYERWGFRKVGTHTFQLGDDAQTDWIMQRGVGDG
jgi:ribosomal protein S18 acetylase RimI-like enzyme